MHPPLPVLSSRSYHMTRRCIDGQHLLDPDDPKLNEGLLYLLAEAAKHCDVQILWLSVQRDRISYGLDDLHGHYPDFLARFHHHAAKLVNRLRGRRGSLWESSEQTEVVECLDAQGTFNEMISALAKPVADQLVDRAGHWPGLSSLRAQLRDDTLMLYRPKWLTKGESKLPEIVSIRFKRPPDHRDLDEGTWRRKLITAIKAEEQKAADERLRTGRRSLGRKAIRRGTPPAGASHRGTTPKPRPRRRPRRYAASGDPRMRDAAIARILRFQLAYARALAAYRNGNREIIFPDGTWKLFHDGHVARHLD